jgi:hypothetical protein
VILALVFLLVLAFVALSQPAAAIVEYRDNDDSDHAIWLEPPTSLDAVHVWDGWGDDNPEDWWQFNASAGQHVQINFRKYERFQDPQPPFESGSYQLNYRVLDVALNEIYHYSKTYDNPLDDDDHRDSWSYIVPENLGGKFYIRVWVTMNNRNTYYWLNLTVEDPRDFNAASQYSGTLNISNGYTADYDPVDYFKIDLTAGETSADMVTVSLHREEVDADIRLEVWEYIPFGGPSQRNHMVNRTADKLGTDHVVRFIATYTGMYTIRVFRDFWDVGISNYTVSVALGSRAHDGNELVGDGVLIKHVDKIRRVPIELGYDTHDWYQVQILEGDTLFKVIVTLDDPDLEDGHGYELVVYNEQGTVMWAESSVTAGPSYRDSISLPPSGTTTIFDRNTTYYVRFSVDAAVTADTVEGWRALYDIEFVLENRAPELIMPFNETYEWDEDTSISINLDAHFFDPDGDNVLYYLMSPKGHLTYDTVGFLYNGWLNITSEENWFGQTVWTIKAQDEGSTEDSHKIFFDLVLIVNPVSDLPFSNGTLKRQCDEETSVSLELTKLFYDVDEGLEGVLTFGYNDTGIIGVQVDLDEETGHVDLVPGPDVAGKFNFDFYCMDDNEVPVGGIVELTVVGINDIPRIVAPIPNIEMEEGDEPVEIDLSPYFIDVDGDDLLYTFTVPSAYSGDINVYHKNNLVTESTIVIELLDEHFYAHVVINITCKDPDNTLVKQDLVIDIANVPNAPVISVTPAGAAPDVDEMQTATFAVTDLQDADELEFGLHNFTWYLDEVMVLQETGSLSSYVYKPDYEASGPHTVRLVVRDPTGLGPATDPSWTFQVRNVNRQPMVDITTPATTLDEDQKIALTVDAYDPDGDELEITWYLITKDEDKPLGVGSPLEVKLPAGTNKIDVEVTDGKGGMATASFTQKVNAVEEEGGMGIWIGLIVLIVIVAVIALMLLKMRGGKAAAQPEATIDIESLQQGYDPSQGRGGGPSSEYEEYNPRPGSSEEYEELKR